MCAKFTSLSFLLLAALWTAHLCGCATYKPAALQPVRQVLELAPGDSVFVVFTSEPFSVGMRRVVDAKGELDLPLGVRLNVEGMTLRQTEHAISYRYPNCYGPPCQILVSQWE